MKKIIKPVLILSAAILAILNIGTSIALALSTSLVLFLNNKIMYKNKKSELFGIDNKNVINQKVGVNFIKTPFIKNKKKYFATEMMNLALDLNKGQEYKTVSQSIVLKSLKSLANTGVITDLEYNELESNKTIKDKINNLFVNVGMGNYKNVFKGSKKFKISFTRSDKVIDKEYIESYLGEESNLLYKNGEISKVKFLDNKEKVINKRENEELLDVMPPSKLDKIEEEKSKLYDLKNDLINLKYDNNKNVNERNK